MKQLLKPGSTLDLLAPHELMDALERHSETLLDKLGKNARFVRKIETEQVANGTFEIVIGPPDGFLWDVRAYVFSVAPLNNNYTAAMYYNDTSNLSNIVFPSVSSNDLFSEGGKILIVHSGESLILTQGATNPVPNGNYVALTLFCVEVPNSHEAQLLL